MAAVRRVGDTATRRPTRGRHVESRLKTGALILESGSNPRRAEFFALPGFQHRERFVGDFLDGPESADSFVAAR